MSPDARRTRPLDRRCTSPSALTENLLLVPSTRKMHNEKEVGAGGTWNQGLETWYKSKKEKVS